MARQIESEPHRASRADLGLLALTLIWAVNFSVIKAGLSDVPPFVFNALRFPLAGLTLLLLLRSRGRIPLPRREDLGRIILLGVFGNVVYQFFFIIGMDLTRAGNASLLLATTPIFVALWSVTAGHERSHPRVWAGAVGTLAGMAVVVAGGPGGFSLDPDTITGDLLMIGASLVWSFYTVGARKPVQRYGSLAVTAWTLWIGTAGLVLVGIPGMLTLDWTAVPSEAWGSIAYAGALGIGVAYALWYYGVRHLGSTRTAIYANLVPVLALLVAWYALGEVPTAAQIVGAAIIIGGIRLVRSHG